MSKTDHLFIVFWRSVKSINETRAKIEIWGKFQRKETNLKKGEFFKIYILFLL